MDILFNKLIDVSINEGLFIKIISQTLTVSDLAKFKTVYTKMNIKRLEHIADLKITPLQIEQKEMISTQIIEYDDSLMTNTTKEEMFTMDTIKEEIESPKKEKQQNHGFDEDSF